MEILKKVKMYTLLISLFYFIMGIIMLLNPQFVLDAVNYIIGIFVLVYGVIYVARLLGKETFNTLSKFSLIAGILCILFGVYLLLNPTLLSSIIPFATGVLLVVDGITKMREAFEFKKFGYVKWWLNLIISLLFISFGIFMIVNAFGVSKTILRIIGAVLIVDALSDIWSYFCYKKYTPEKQTKIEITNVKEAKIIPYKED